MHVALMLSAPGQSEQSLIVASAPVLHPAASYISSPTELLQRRREIELKSALSRPVRQLSLIYDTVVMCCMILKFTLSHKMLCDVGNIICN